MFKKFEYVLLSLVALVPIGFFTTYGIAVANNHVDPGWPYISDTGTTPYESCVFGQILSVGAFLNIAIVYVRFLHTKIFIDSFDEFRRLVWVNRASFLVGILVTIGITIVGNFQETNVVNVHFVGAGLAFLGLFIYVCILTYISYKLRTFFYSPKRMVIFRLAVIGICFLFGLLFSIFIFVAHSKFKGKDKLKWKPEDGGFTEHIISTSSEWIVAMLIVVLLATFLPDFTKIHIGHPIVSDSRQVTQIKPSSYGTTIATSTV